MTCCTVDGGRPPRLRLAVVLVVLSLLASPAVGLTPRNDAGVFFTGQSVATPRGALAASTNPSGLADIEGFETRLQFSGGGGWVGGTRGAGWGLFSAARTGRLVLAATLERVNDAPGGVSEEPGQLDITRASLAAGLALGDKFRLGLAHRTHSLQARGHAEFSSWDVGFLARPWSWLSVGGRVTGVGAETEASTGGAPLQDRYAWGFALRPLAGSDRLTWALDFEWPRGGHIGAITTSLRSRLFDGVSAMLEHRTVRPASPDDVEDKRTSLLFEFGFGHVGTEVGMRGDKPGQGAGDGAMQVAARVSTDVPTTLTAPGASAVRISLRGALQERPGNSKPHFGRLLMDLDAIAHDDAVELLVLHGDGLLLTWAQVDELRDAIGRIRKASKKVVFYSAEIGTRSMMVASACDRIAMPPSGLFVARGVRGRFIGLKETLAHVGVATDTVRFGNWKSAPEMWTRKQLSNELRATMTRLVTARWTRFVDAVALGRGVTATVVRSALERGAFYPEDARGAGLIDAVAHPKPFEKLLTTWGMLEKGNRVRKYRRTVRRRVRWGQRPRIAVVAMTGNIVTSEGSSLPVGQTLAGRSMAKVIDKLGRRSAVRGMVARIDSGGGGIHGSELMYTALRRFADTKPVIASLGAVAASGGYWAALGADHILADPATITGSIGIFAFKPSLAGLWGKIGLGTETVARGPNADINSIDRLWTKSEKELVARSLRRFYDLFLQRVSLRRKIARPRLLRLAEGRLWLGDEARSHGLVDGNGGMLAAIAEVRKRTRLVGDGDVLVEFWPRPTFRSVLRKWAGLSTEASDRASAMVKLFDGATAAWLDRAMLVNVLGAGQPLALTPLPLDEPAR